MLRGIINEKYAITIFHRSVRRKQFGGAMIMVQSYLAFVLSLLFLLLFNICTVATIDDELWMKHIDRIYTRKVIHPFIAKIGRKSDVLEIGMESHNIDDCARIRMPCINFYINDISNSEEYSLPPGKGTFIEGSFASLASDVQYKEKFGLIFDFGVLGVRTWTWKDVDIKHHVESYRKLLKPKGVLLLKWDLGFRSSDHFAYWLKVENMLQEQLSFVGRHILYDKKCDQVLVQKYQAEFKSSLHISHGYVGNFFNNSHYQARSDTHEVQEECEMFLFSHWTNGEIPEPTG